MPVPGAEQRLRGERAHLHHERRFSEQLLLGPRRGDQRARPRRGAGGDAAGARGAVPHAPREEKKRREGARADAGGRRRRRRRLGEPCGGGIFSDFGGRGFPPPTVPLRRRGPARRPARVPVRFGGDAEEGRGHGPRARRRGSGARLRHAAAALGFEEREARGFDQDRADRRHCSGRRNQARG